MSRRHHRLLKTSAEVHRKLMRDPEFREEWERTALGRAVAIAIVRYRAEHDLSQSELAAILGMKQPAVARIELGEHNPSWETLFRLAEGLGLAFAIDIGPKGKRRLPLKGDVVRERVNGTRGRIVVSIR